MCWIEGTSPSSGPLYVRGIWSAHGSAPGAGGKVRVHARRETAGGYCSILKTLSTIVKCRRAERHQDLPDAATPGHALVPRPASNRREILNRRPLSPYQPLATHNPRPPTPAPPLPPA